MIKSLFFCLFLFVNTLCAQDIVGFWKIIDDATGNSKSIIAIYEHGNRYYGRIIGTCNDKGVVNDSIEDPKSRAPGVKGNPFYSGLDIIWGLRARGSKYIDGNILDPSKGRVYGAELWVEKDNLIVRGKVLFLGRNQTWFPAKEADFPSGFTIPDLTQLIPSVPKVK